MDKLKFIAKNPSKVGEAFVNDFKDDPFRTSLDVLATFAPSPAGKTRSAGFIARVLGKVKNAKPADIANAAKRASRDFRSSKSSTKVSSSKQAIDIFRGGAAKPKRGTEPAKLPKTDRPGRKKRPDVSPLREKRPSKPKKDPFKIGRASWERV